MEFSFGQGVDYRKRPPRGSRSNARARKAPRPAPSTVRRGATRKPPSPIRALATATAGPVRSNNRTSRPASPPKRVSILDQVFGPGTAKASGFRPRHRPQRRVAQQASRPARKRSVSPIRALRKPVNKQPRRRVFRPTLSAQLAAIAKSAEEVTTSLNKSSAGPTPLLTTPSSKFTVGRLECKYPSPVKFFADHCSYVFHHPFQKSQITMVMRYNDMTNVKLKDCVLSFTIPHMLAHFGKDYDPRNRTHAISIELSSQTDATTLRSRVYGLILSRSS